MVLSTKKWLLHPGTSPHEKQNQQCIENDPDLLNILSYTHSTYILIPLASYVSLIKCNADVA